MPGSLVIPNTFATQSGNVPVSQLDSDLSTIANYVNAREITLGVIGSRPAAGTAGRFYFATDVNGGTLYEDNGSSWTALTGGVSANSSSYDVRGLVGVNNAGTPNTKYDLAADLVALRNTSDGTIIVRTNTGTITNDVGVAGSAANGRDQAGAFSASSWIHFYFIWNGATLATLSSATAPPTGPTLPTGYTHWAYAGAIRFDGSSHLIPTRMRGSWMCYEAAQPALSSGSATTETSVSLTALIPPNALNFTMNGGVSVVGNSAGDITATPTIRIVTGINYLVSAYTLQGFGGAHNFGWMAQDITLPNISQQFFYLWNLGAGASSPALNLNLARYQVPNGGE